jgi:hypothetical protein
MIGKDAPIKTEMIIEQWLLKFKEKINSLFIEHNGINSKVRVVLTSGRGKPTNLPKGIPFISYSVLSQYLLEKRFKLFLTEMLYSAQPINTLYYE